MDNKAPHPTRLSHFAWKPKSKTLRITLNEGSCREVKWTSLGSHNGPKIFKESNKAPSGPPPTPNISETQQAKTREKGNLAQSARVKSNLGSHFCIGEASGTKGVTLDSTTRVSFVEEGASDLEYQGESPALVSAGFEDGISGGHLDGTGDDSPIRDSLEVLPQAVLPMKLTMVEVNQSREVWGVESSSLNSEGPSVEEDVVPLHLVTYPFDNNCATKELTTESCMLEEPWKSGSMPRSLFLYNVKQYMLGEY
jgi:hypothetical protein